MARVYLSSEEIPLLKDKAHRHFLGIGHMNKLPVSDYTTLADGNAVLKSVVLLLTGTPGHTGFHEFQGGRFIVRRGFMHYCG